MSRSGYTDCCDGWDLIRWRGAVKSAIRGKRGQAFLREMLKAFDALPNPILITDELIDSYGDVCAIGSVGQARGMDMSLIDYQEPDEVAKAFGIARALAAEIAFENDESWDDNKPSSRFRRMRKWITSNLIEEKEKVK